MSDVARIAQDMRRSSAKLDRLLIPSGDIRLLLNAVETLMDGNRPLPFDREHLGRMVREAWVRWAETQPAPKPSWLVPYDELSEPDKEADRQIGETVARWTLIGDAARTSIRWTRSGDGHGHD